LMTVIANLGKQADSFSDADKFIEDGKPIPGGTPNTPNQDDPELWSEYETKDLINSTPPEGKQAIIQVSGTIPPPSWVPKKLHAVWNDAVEHYMDVGGNDPNNPFAQERVVATYRALLSKYKLSDIHDEDSDGNIENNENTISQNEKIALALLKMSGDDNADGVDDDEEIIDDEDPNEDKQDQKLDEILDLVTDISDELLGDGKPVEVDGKQAKVRILTSAGHQVGAMYCANCDFIPTPWSNKHLTTDSPCPRCHALSLKIQGSPDSSEDLNDPGDEDLNDPGDEDLNDPGDPDEEFPGGSEQFHAEMDEDPEE